MGKFLKLNLIISVLGLFFAILCIASTPSSIDLKGAELIQTYSSGAKEYRLSDSSRAVIWPDGRSRLTMPDGTVIHTWPANGNNEVRRVQRLNGTTESVFSDGTEKETHANGTVLWIFPDGMQREERPDGGVWESIIARKDLVDPEVVKMSPWPRRVKPMDRVVFSGELQPGFKDPWACVILPGGGLLEIGAESFIQRNGRFSVPVIMNDGPGIYRVEIIARGKFGNRVALNVTIWAGIDPDAEDERPTFYRTIDPSEPLHRIEGKFHQLINREREKRGINPVTWDGETAQLARHMSREMAAEGYFGHVSPKWGNIAKRAAKLLKWKRIAYGIPSGEPTDKSPNYIADDIVKARSVGGAMAILLESPAHRRVLLSSSWSHAGVGISRVKEGDGRDVIIVIAMIKLNRPKQDKTRPKPKSSNDRDTEDLFKIYGRP